MHDLYLYCPKNGGGKKKKSIFHILFHWNGFRLPEMVHKPHTKIFIAMHPGRVF